jgi:glycerophosphoryl diester phosphodiesterase
MVHRGAAGGDDTEVVENTLPAFRRAYSLGFRYFETDVRVTADGVLVAAHDASLRRIAGERVRIADVTSAELSETPVGGEPLPRLLDLFETFPDVSFNVDPKVDAAVRPLVDLLTDLDVLERSCIASFSDRRLRWVRASLGAQVCTAAGPRELSRAVAQAASGADIDLPGVDVLQIPRWMTRQVFEARARRLDLRAAAQRVALPVHVWTVNDGAYMQRLLDRGVDGVMSDDTDLLVEVFGSNGWKPNR